MIFCTSCGKFLADDAKFCDACGQKVEPVVIKPAERSNEQAQQQPPPQPQPSSQPNLGQQQYRPPVYIPYQPGQPGHYPQPGPQNSMHAQNYYKVPYNGLAIAGFVVSLCSILVSTLNVFGGASIVGIVLSAVGMNQINKNYKRGKGLAVAGLVIGIVGTLYGLFFYSTLYRFL